MRVDRHLVAWIVCVLFSDIAGAQTVTNVDTEREAEEVVVTGTHIRNTEPVAPVLVYTNEDFDKAGANTAQEFLANLPQNFGGSQSADTTGDEIDQLAFDPGMGSGINLRGVGSESTLVLIDGRRVAPAGRGDYGDISMIPLAAVERIEIITDGASALYGSDAVGGVVNFIMRKDFSGAETRLRYGDTTEGGLSQKQVSQVFGAQWGSGSMVTSYDYLDQAPLSRYDRDFSARAEGEENGPRALIPGEERHGVSVFGKQEISSSVTASFNAMYSRRDGERWDWDNGFIQETDVTRKQFGGGAGLEIALGGSWYTRLNGSYDEGRADRKTVDNPLTGSNYGYQTVYDLWSTDLMVGGELLRHPWGSVALAAGVAYREESFDYAPIENGVPRIKVSMDPQRVKSAYAELSAPFGERGDRPHAPFKISLAGRYEDYNTFGNTFDPTYAVRWTPLKELSVYATYGTSFKAPNLYESQEIPFFHTSSVYINRLPGVSRALIIQGNNDDLTEQTAQTFTAGFELNLPVSDGMRARVNYFDIDYDDRIQRLTVSPVILFTTPAYQSLVTRRGDVPDADFNALIAHNLSGANARVFLCPTPLTPAGDCTAPPESFQVLVDSRLQNFASVRVNGLDLSLSQDLTWGNDRLTLNLDGSYFLSFDQQLNPASDARDILNTLYNPVDFRLRGSASWTREHWSSTVSMNYTVGYSTAGAILRTDDVTPMPAADIASWTTFDWVLSYTVGERGAAAWLDGVAMSLGIMNVFDKDPPYIDDQYFGLGYDPANADPRGRRFSLTVSKRW